MIVLTWVLGIVSVLGVAGTIAAAILFPAVVVPVLQRLIDWLLGCKPCLYALALIAVAIGSWWHGYRTKALACHEAELSAVIRNQEFDLVEANRAKTDADKRIREIEEGANEQAKKDAEFIASLKARPACLFDDDDVGGVSNDKPRTRLKVPSIRSK